MSTASASTERRSDRARPRAGSRSRRAEGLDRLRVLLAGAVGAVVVGYALLVPVAGLLLVSGGRGSVDGAFAFALPLWLAAHLIPIEVDGRPLGVLPLLPTIIAVLVVACASAWSVRRLGGRLRHDAGSVVAGQSGAAATVAVLAGALLPGDVAVATPWASMVGAGLLAGIGAAAGVLHVCSLPPEWARRLQGWPRAGITGARAGAIGLVLTGALVLLLATAVRAGDVAASFADLAPGAGAGAGVLLLAVGYLPNALAAGASWALGAGLTVGAGQYGPFGTVPDALPPFPLFAVLSPEPAPGWTVLVLLLPLGTGVIVGRVCRRALGQAAPLRDRLAAAGAAALLTAAAVAVVGALAGGSLAGGPYDPVSLSPAAAGAAALVLLGVPATIACAGVDELLGRPPARAAGTRRAGGRPQGVAGRVDGPRRGAGGRAEPASRDRGPQDRGRTASVERAIPVPDEHREDVDGERHRDPGGPGRPRTVADLVAATEFRPDPADDPHARPADGPENRDAEPEAEARDAEDRDAEDGTGGRDGTPGDDGR